MYPMSRHNRSLDPAKPLWLTLPNEEYTVPDMMFAAYSPVLKVDKRRPKPPRY